MFDANEVVTYDDLIEAELRQLENDHLRIVIDDLEAQEAEVEWNDALASYWEDLIDTYGESRLIELGADL